MLLGPPVSRSSARGPRGAFSGGRMGSAGGWVSGAHVPPVLPARVLDQPLHHPRAGDLGLGIKAARPVHQGSPARAPSGRWALQQILCLTLQSLPSLRPVQSPPPTPALGLAVLQPSLWAVTPITLPDPVTCSASPPFPAAPQENLLAAVTRLLSFPACPTGIRFYPPVHWVGPTLSTF